MSNLTSIISTGLNNPDCSFYVGAFVGQWSVLKAVFILICLMILYKLVDKLALEPLIKTIKEKFKLYKTK